MLYRTKPRNIYIYTSKLPVARLILWKQMFFVCQINKYDQTNVRKEGEWYQILLWTEGVSHVWRTKSKNRIWTWAERIRSLDVM